MKLDTWLALVAFATVLGLVLVALGMRDRRRAAAEVERNGPSGHAAGRARAEAASLAVNPAPPAWDRVATLEWAHSAEVRADYRRLAPVRAEAARASASAHERTDEVERQLRRSLAETLRDGVWREVLGGALVLVGAVASLIAAVS